MGVIRLTATMAAPIVITDDLHLDGLLASAHPNCRIAPIDRSTPLGDLVTPPLPIASATFRGVTVALATVATFADDARLSSDHTVKRRDGEDIAALSRSIHLGLGPGKNRMHRLPTIITPTVSWLAIGDRRPLLRLARRLTHLGGWRSAGYGVVATWEAAYLPEDADAAAVLTLTDVAQRHIPASWVEWADSTETGPLRPPYWHPARTTDAIVRAGTRCALNPSLFPLLHALARPDACRAHRDRHVARKIARRTLAHGGVSPEI